MICWDPKELHRILQPDAEAINDHVFNAVHCQTELHMSRVVNAPLVPVRPNDFVEAFLHPDKKSVLAVVLGESGTGKSHLIQWLRLQVIEALNGDEDTVILTVHRTGTSLRSILEKLINCLPEREQERYREKLQGNAGAVQSDEAKVDKFLNSLEFAIRHGCARENTPEHELAVHLANLLLDPTYRKVLTKNTEGAVHLIARHIFDVAKHRTNQHERREFKYDDLPAFPPLYTGVATATREAMDFLEMCPQESICELLNKSLAPAIAATLNFSADNLIELMNTIRRDFRKQNRRLILLIEDFARLQGIDTALLQALMTPMGQGEEELCEMRWAMAVTTGYYQRLAETVQTRLNIIVDMDKSKPASWPKLTAGYLNALRLGEAKLKAASEVENACIKCSRKAECFSTFGHVDGIGMFPFTETAIGVMVSRLSLDAITPRAFMNNVLVRVLENASMHLENGAFPSDELLRSFSGHNAITSLKQQRLAEIDPMQHLQRLALLELWDGSGQLVNLHPGIYKAFGLAQLPDDGTSKKNTDDKTEKKDNGIDPPSRIPVNPEDNNLHEIQNWVDDNNELISQVLADKLRGLVYSALEAFIDWDRLGYKKSAVTAPTGGSIPFRKLSIGFVRKETDGQANPLVFISIEPSLKNANALKALLLINKSKETLDFPDAGEYLPTLLEFLRWLAVEVEVQLAKIYKDHHNWDYVHAATEFLVLTAYQGNLVTVDSDTNQIVSKIFDPDPPCILGVTEGLFSFNNSLTSVWSQNQEFLRSLCSGTKGGQVGDFVRIVPVIKSIQALKNNGWVLTQDPPEPDQIKLKALQDFVGTYRRIKAGYMKAVNEEIAHWRRWGLGVRQEIGEGVTFEKFKRDLMLLMNLIRENGIAANNTIPGIIALLNGMNIPDCDQSLRYTSKLMPSDGINLLDQISFIITTHEQIDQLRSRVRNLLHASEVSVSNLRDNMKIIGGEGLLANKENIRASLSQIQNILYGINSISRS